MTGVRCPYCDQVTVAEPNPAGSPLPRLRDGFFTADGQAVGVRSGLHQCAGLAGAARIYAHAEAEQ